MNVLTVHTHQFDYPIMIGENILDKLTSYVEAATKIVIITDHCVESLHMKTLKKQINKPCYVYSITPGEASKSLVQYVEIQSMLIEKNIDRYSLVIAFGGGVVGDLAGFVAATYMRGIAFIQLPTTLLAHDSAVGGKVAVNHPLGKNLIGTFYPPIAVIYELSFLTTLSDKEWRSGIAEMVKHGYISKPGLLDALFTLPRLQAFKKLALEETLTDSIAIKQQIVEIDPFEKNIRAYLNFGHTLAHGIELVHASLSHGEAVAIGIGFALFLSEQHGYLNHQLDRYFEFFYRFDYPFPLTLEYIKHYLSFMIHDKKNKGDEIRFILLNQLGEPSIASLKIEEVKDYLQTFILTVKGENEHGINWDTRSSK